jgi:hypothetical protein
LLNLRLDGFGIPAIAALYRVNRTTASRWLAKAGATVEHAVFCELRDTMRLAERDLGSLVRSLLSQVDSSIRTEVSRAFPGPQREGADDTSR